ncbi:hypothetical protein ACFL2V_07155 [Pseudomonadota bacterium]
MASLNTSLTQLSGPAAGISKGVFEWGAFSVFLPQVGVTTNLVFQLQVTDLDGATSTDSITIEVTDGNDPQVYYAPTITSVTASPTSIVAGRSSQLSVSATYPEDGAGVLSYNWSVSPGGSGSFSNPSITNPVFTANSASSNGSSSIIVSVSDSVHSSSQSTSIYISADWDGDGMSNDFENKYGLDPSNPADASYDSDLDGFSNLQEATLGRNPLLNEAVLVVIINSILLN